jgi:hypothetical protein
MCGINPALSASHLFYGLVIGEKTSRQALWHHKASRNISRRLAQYQKITLPKRFGNFTFQARHQCLGL